VRRRKSLLLAAAAFFGLLAALARAKDETPGSKGGPVSLGRAMEVAVRAVGSQSAAWSGGCNIRARPDRTDWLIVFEPIPMGPGLDVMVTVHQDETVTVAPGF
jgi:hypothetical protein